MEIANTKTLRSGQVRPYGDSVYSYEVTFTDDGSDAEIWELCQTVKVARHRKDGYWHNGACGFPFGLESFGSLSKIGEQKYLYTITVPYCD